MRFLLIISILTFSITSCRSCSESSSSGVCIYDEHICDATSGLLESSENVRLCKKLSETECKNLESVDIDKQKFCTPDNDLLEKSMITNVTWFKGGECPRSASKTVDSKTKGACFFKEAVCHIVNERPQIEVAPHACLDLTEEDCRNLEDECESQCVVEDQEIGSGMFCVGDYAKEGDLRKSDFSFYPNSACPKK